MWETLSSKELLNHPRLTIIEDTVLLPSGKETTYIRYADTRDAVTIIAKNSEGEILLQKEYSYPPNKELLQLPGGGISKDEDVLVGANRELSEEMDYEAKKMKIIGKFLLNNRRSNAYMYVVSAQDLEIKHLEADIVENITPLWLRESEIDKLISEGEIVNQATLAAWSIYKSSN